MLCKKFFHKYNEINPNENIGWEIIDSIPINQKVEFFNMNATTL